MIPRLLNDGKLDISKPCFVLLDQESTQLAWDTIETLALCKEYEAPDTDGGRPKNCKVELWILFNYIRLSVGCGLSIVTNILNRLALKH